MSKLLVYRASAGSGKTFRLAAEYIKQVIANPESYKNILAVTFTNKATAEMKGRILNELFALSQGEGSGIGNTVAKELNLPISTIQTRAQQALSYILHDYSRFSVSTIDSFVQRVIQALLWEIGEQGGVDIELDTTPVLEHAADNLLDSASQFDELLAWLTSMGYSLLDEGKSWDVRSKLIELGKQLFSEKFRLMSRDDIQKFTDRERVNLLKVKLQEISTSVVKEVNALANQVYNKLDARGITPDAFSYGNSGVMGFFKKCASLDSSASELPSTDSARMQKALNDASGVEWVNKSTYNDTIAFAPIENMVQEVLHPNLTKLVEIIDSQKAQFISAKLILKNLENLALIGDLWNKVRELSREEGFLLLSDSGHLLREFVKESDAPFVYEKIGTRYDVYMIDEFQDTSEVQWHNFKPLIENSLSQEGFSMIVGDVKQSIYRWRNGDWSILASGIEKDLGHFGINEVSLDTNWRSLPAIIEFNNNFFKQTRELVINEIARKASTSTATIVSNLQSQVEKAYKDIKQKPPTPLPEGIGYVEVKFFEMANKTNCDLFLAQEIPTLIETLRNRYSPNDMAILVRTKNDGQRIASMLLEHNRNSKDKSQHISFVSQEGLELKASTVVRLTIAAFRIILDSGNEIAKRALAKEIASLKEEQNHNWHNYFSSSFTIDEVEWLSSLNTRPLQEVFEAVAKRYNLFTVEGELAHLAELHEHISTISSKGGGDVNRFLEWWEQKGDSLSLTVPESTNALSILTIHKSKGLQFPVVIIPYANWKFRPAGTRPLLWVESDVEPFDILPKYPIQATKEAAESLFAKDILEEEMREMVDNVNMLYVAFTRPEKELYVFAPLSKKEMDGEIDIVDSASKVIRTVIPNLGATSILESELSQTYTFGKSFQPIDGKAKDLSSKNGWIIDNYPVGQATGNIKFKMEAEEFFLSSPSDRLAPLKHGKVMHELFSNIFTINDIDNAIHKMIANGLIDSATQEVIREKIKNILSQNPFASWFSEEWEVRTEATILTRDGRNYRPDRVMVKQNQTIVVDFKFGIKLPAHIKQVQRYANLLEKMGYNSIAGYVWYVDENVLEKV